MESRHRRRLVVFLLLFVLALSAASCGRRIDVGETQTREEAVAQQDASRVEVDLRMGAGRLDVSVGGQELMEATFTYDVHEWEPIVTYNVNDGVGQLEVSQPEIEEIGIPDDDIDYQWELRFSEEVPLEMEVNLGAGQSDLDLANLDLRSLRMNTGAGDVEVSLGGGLDTFRMETGAGEINLNLANDWERDLQAELRGGVGSVTVLLPCKVGTRVTVRQGIGSIKASGLSQSGDTYTTDAFGESEVTLDITIEGGIGEVNLRVGG